MTLQQQPLHHPQDDLLIGHATCREHPAVGLLMSTHAALCATCRGAVADLETIGSALLEEDGEIAPSAALRERTLAAARASSGTTAAPSPLPPVPPSAVPRDLAAAVRFVLALPDEPKQARWHWRAPGVSEVRLPLDWNGIPVTVTRLRSGLHIPQHTHAGRELTLVLRGSVTDAKATYRTGDVADYDSSVSHEQFVDSDEDCLCLVVNESRLVPQTLLGRALAWISGA